MFRDLLPLTMYKFISIKILKTVRLIGNILSFENYYVFQRLLWRYFEALRIRQRVAF